MKLCKDCIYVKRTWIAPFTREYDRCLCPSGSRNAVTGKLNANYCVNARAHPLTSCGPEAKWYVPRIKLDSPLSKHDE